MTIRLYASKGCGSICVEAVLALTQTPFARIEVSPWSAPEDAATLAPLNPLLQVPTLVLADGTVLSETLAILPWLVDRTPGCDLLPPPGSAQRAQVQRKMVFLNTAIYVPMVMGDFPGRWLEHQDAQGEFARGVDLQIAKRWAMGEALLDPQPAAWLGGTQFGLLDIYAAMLSRWRPGPAEVRRLCPRLAPVLDRIEAEPVIAKLWAEQF